MRDALFDQQFKGGQVLWLLDHQLREVGTGGRNLKGAVQSLGMLLRRLKIFGRPEKDRQKMRGIFRGACAEGDFADDSSQVRRSRVEESHGEGELIESGNRGP